MARPYVNTLSSLLKRTAKSIPMNDDTVCHAKHEWARDDDGDGLREVHINTVEGMWTLVRNFMRLFRGVHKKYWAGYLAICEFHINLKRITPAFVAAHL